MKANFNLKRDFLYLGFSLLVLFVFMSCDQLGQKTISKKPDTVTDKVYKAGNVSFTMKPIKKVEAGTLGTADIADNGIHKVNLDAYFISETEVTQELYKEVMGSDSNPSQNLGEANLPVDTVTWFNAVLFANALTKKTGLGEAECVYYSDPQCTKVYTQEDAQKAITSYFSGKIENFPYQNMNKKGFRLPTEAEWEWAAKGGKEDKWAGTDDKNTLIEYAWYNFDDSVNFGNAKSHPVKGKKPNGYGLYDMSGNVYEWCWDWHTAKPAKDDVENNPAGPATTTTGGKVYRGGFVIANSDATRNAWSAGDPPMNDYKFCGIRLVCRP
nr:SUMF1/EgtB/PvdO family nonheme iron enzyme [Treponema denticola]